MLTVSVWLDESLLHFCFSLPFGISYLQRWRPRACPEGFQESRLLVHPNTPSHFSEMDLVTTGSSLIFCVWARASRFRCQHCYSFDYLYYYIATGLTFARTQQNPIRDCNLLWLLRRMFQYLFAKCKHAKHWYCMLLVSSLCFYLRRCRNHPLKHLKHIRNMFETYCIIIFILCSVSNFQVKLQKIHKIPK